MPKVNEQETRISDAGIGGSKTYTGNWPHIILDTLHLRHGRNGLSVTDLGVSMGAFASDTSARDTRNEVLDALRYLEDLGLVVEDTAKGIWMLKGNK